MLLAHRQCKWQTANKTVTKEVVFDKVEVAAVVVVVVLVLVLCIGSSRSSGSIVVAVVEVSSSIVKK